MGQPLDAVEFEKLKHDLQLSVEKFKSEMAAINEELREKWLRDREAWLARTKEQWARERESSQAMFRGVIVFAETTIKSLLLMNGGALIALLALLGALWTRNDAKATQIASVVGPSITLFVIGTTAATATAAASYIAQVLFSEKSAADKTFWRRPGEWVRIVAVALGATSLSFFLWGAVRAAGALGA